MNSSGGKNYLVTIFLGCPSFNIKAPAVFNWWKLDEIFFTNFQSPSTFGLGRVKRHAVAKILSHAEIISSAQMSLERERKNAGGSRTVITIKQETRQNKSSVLCVFGL